MIKCKSFSVKKQISEDNSILLVNPQENKEQPDSNDAVNTFIPLKQQFRKNGLPYQLIQRNEVAAVFGVGGTYTDKILHYEVCELHFRKAHVFQGKSFPDEYVLPSNEQFGRDKSRAIVKYRDALLYFDAVTREIRAKECLPGGELPSGGEEYHPREIMSMLSTKMT